MREGGGRLGGVGIKALLRSIKALLSFIKALLSSIKANLSSIKALAPHTPRQTRHWQGLVAP